MKNYRRDVITVMQNERFTAKPIKNIRADLKYITGVCDAMNQMMDSCEKGADKKDKEPAKEADV